MLWIALSAATLVVVALAVYLGFRWLTGRAMFEPGTVAKRIFDAGESLDPLPSRLPDRWRVTKDIELVHDSFGEGQEHVLFVHGGPGFPTRGRPRAMQLLAESYTVHLFDQRGCGRSSRPFDRAPEGSLYQQLGAIESTLGLAEQVADIERIRRVLGSERITLVGHSFGALVAALYAAEFADRVSTLVLVSPAPLHVMPNEADLFALVRERLSMKDRTEYDAYLTTYFDFRGAFALDEATLSRRYGRFRTFYARATGMTESQNHGDAGGFMILATYASLGRRHDWRGAFARITSPTILLHGSADLIPEQATREFARSIPGAHVSIVNAAHFPLDEAADTVVALIREAMSRFPPPAG